MNWKEIAASRQKEIDSIVTVFQSKKAGIKKQLTHFIGKFMIVKAENNTLRKTVKVKSVTIQTLLADCVAMDKTITELKDGIEQQKKASFNTVLNLTGDIRRLENANIQLKDELTIKVGLNKEKVEA